MAILANVRDSFGSSQRYLYIRGYHPDRVTGLIRIMVEIYKDQATRQAFKAATAAIPPLDAAILEKDNARASALAAFLDLPTEEQVQGAEANQEAQETFETDLIALRQQRDEQAALQDANKRGMEIVVPVDPGVITIGDNGEVLLSDLYQYMETTAFPGSTRAD